jgi:hypothetical protein
MPKEIWSAIVQKGRKFTTHRATAQALRAGLLANAQSISGVRWCIRERVEQMRCSITLAFCSFQPEREQVDLTQKYKKRNSAVEFGCVCESWCVHPTAYLVKQTRHMYNLDGTSLYPRCFHNERESRPWSEKCKKVCRRARNAPALF